MLKAEWLPQSAILMAWPKPTIDWGCEFSLVCKAFSQIIAAVSQTQSIWLLTGDQAETLKWLSDQGLVASNLTLHTTSYDDSWCRDYGPLSVTSPSGTQFYNFQYNAWGEKFSFQQDNQINSQLHTQNFLPNLHDIDLILEGGSIDTNGSGCLLTTESCLLSSTRNPTMQKKNYEQVFAEYFGIKKVHWIKNSFLIGDDTDGHIDMLGRFIDARTICYSTCEVKTDPHYEPMQAMYAEFRHLRDCDNQPYELIPLPIPAPIMNRAGERLPGSYCNFLITNHSVLVPLYQDSNDQVAIERLTKSFPSRKIIGIDCRALIHQGGSLHCTTMQIGK